MKARTEPCPFHLNAANDNGPPPDEAAVQAAVLALARLIGRQIARQHHAARLAANDDHPPE